ncbi:DUF397 domain-containing protein [Yinghuangia sp. ASG 101]|uniref:DUF397 domain-containing protein n=1 Tax=Yinghuangia sp. ASG 101 TaxID=2896848 RepID=UPI001E4E10E5|nr:DUF397 domain-containing protein [Yinghuangia sp. ASG 101]UGQ14781.1 DUF397 domain-containing protein [Yinghuangia sp. ASG 101]
MRKFDCTNAAWRKSSYSGGEGQCVEVAVIRGAVATRDSKNPDRPAVVFTPESWSNLELTLRNNEFTSRI